MSKHEKPGYSGTYPWFQRGIWSLLITVAGILIWRGVHYLYRLLRQVRLLPSALPLDLADHETVEAKAVAIATGNVRAAIEKRRLPDGREKVVLCAGSRNFREPWARDFSFASFGLLELKEYQAAKETLDLFFMNQRPDGQFPVKVHSTSVPDRFLHSLFKREQPISSPLRPKYRTAHGTISLDGNALLVIAALNYVKQSNDRNFGKTYWYGLKRAITWLEQHALEEDGLLHQGAFTDWADSVGRTGRILYTNVLYWKALVELAAAAPFIGAAGDAEYFQRRVYQLTAALNDHFWRPDLGYFVTSQIFDNLSSSGNLMAVCWGLTSPDQAHQILDKMNDFDMANPVPTQVVHRAYPAHLIALENRLAGIAHYHTHAAWLWLGSWHVIALTRMERLVEAEELLYRISKVIVRDGVVHEVYGPDSHYLSTFWYTSEAPLTWSAGMFIHAYHVYQRHVKEQSDDSAKPISNN
jgi:GH15 family glucan-1,4-alpha-glucosidase